MNPRFAKIICCFESGLISASEVANGFLCDLVFDQEIDSRCLSDVQELPETVKGKFFQLLHSIKGKGYQWTPFLLGERTTPLDPNEYSERLRRLCELLNI